MCKNLDITMLPCGWKRYEHTRTGVHLDFDTQNVAHQILLAHYETRADWHEVATPAPCDVDSSEQGENETLLPSL